MQAAPSCYGSMVASTSEEVTTSTLSRGPMTMSVSKSNSQFIEAPAFFYDMDTDLKDLKTALKDVDLLNDSGYRSVMERSTHPFATSLVFHEDNGFDSEDDATDEHWDGYLTVGGDRIKIRDMSDILATRYAFISGARTTEGLTIVTFPDSRSTLPFEDYSLLVKYLLQVPPLEDSHKGFVIIIDRRSDKWSSVRTLLLQISSFFPGKICVTFVIKPEGVLQRALEVGYRGAADTCSFQVIQLESSAELRKYIHHEFLTMDVGGLIKYNHLEWVQHRMDIERMKASATAIAASLTEFGKTLRETELPNDADSTARILELQTAEKMAIKEEFKIAVRKGFTLLKSVRQLDKKPTPEQLSPTRLHNVTAIERMLVQLEETERSFDSFWTKHERRLRYCLELRQFEDSFRKLQAAFARHMLYLEEHREVGNCTEKALHLAEQHRQYAEGAMEEVEASRNLKKAGEDLINSNEAELSGSLEPKCEELERMAAALTSALERRGDCLKRSATMHEQIAKANSWCTRGADLLTNGMTDFTNPNPSSSLTTLDAFIEEGTNLNIEFLKDTTSPMNQLLLLTTIETSTLLNLIEERIGDIRRMSLAKRDQLTKLHLQKPPPVQVVTPEKKSKKNSSKNELDSKDVPSCSGESTPAGTLSPRRETREVTNAFDEMIATEISYVADLKDIIIHYLEPFEATENQNSLPDTLRGKPDCLFGNVRELYKFHHRTVLEDLVAARSTAEMCRVLMQHRNQIYVTYRTYCQIHGSNQKVRDSVKNHPFFKECQRNANHNMDMSSYLLKPIQRIMKYQLLLGNIMDDCPADVRDEVAMTRDSMVELLNQIDASMQQLHISGYNGDLKSLGLLRLQTECDVFTYNRKKKAKLSRAQKRFIFFFDGAVMFCKKRVSNPGTTLNSEPEYFEHKFCIPIISLGYDTSSRTGASRFEVWDDAKTDAYVIETIDQTARTKWIQRLGKSETAQDACLENRQRPKSWASTVSNESSCSSSTRESDSTDSTMDTNGNTQTTQVDVPYSPTLDSSIDLSFQMDTTTPLRTSEINNEVELVDSC
ncbi:DH domain-containing protein [Caenorhabditis elegans]|uniref:DH domain-containing protein n=1 Tax=Caenorhabditis elegans TaxID=6239 RepID=H2KYI7_CAEEL|nr:DH domain-containing protein [Caenorhabditis elegans]CCD63467.2 DH domain-containing protein [Caenorhabditis elegans]|eukprot:NP_741736.2 CDC-42 Guanine nucleotide Exchange Factor [Caenorhabditis elegans]